MDLEAGQSGGRNTATTNSTAQERSHNTSKADNVVAIARMTGLGWVCFGHALVEQYRQRSQSHFTRTYRSCQVNTELPPDEVL